MEIVTGDQAPTLERADAVRLLEEMAAVVRTIFAVDAASSATVDTSAPSASAGAGALPVSGGTAPAPVDAPPASPTPAVATPVAAAPLAPIPVPGVAILQEIAFLDD